MRSLNHEQIIDFASKWNKKVAKRIKCLEEMILQVEEPQWLQEVSRTPFVTSLLDDQF